MFKRGDSKLGWPNVPVSHAERNPFGILTAQGLAPSMTSPIWDAK
jgi:hypothetical protein